MKESLLWKLHEAVLAPVLSEVEDLRTEMRNHAQTVLRSLRDLRESGQDPAPFVCVLVEATNIRGRHVTLGGGGRAGRPITVRAQLPLFDGRVTVFTDLERCAVTGIWLGTNPIHAGIGECPVGRFDVWELGSSDLNVATQLRPF